MISITEITRRKLFRYASNDCVCEFISEPLEWLHEASSRVSDRIYICNRIKNEKIKWASRGGGQHKNPAVTRQLILSARY
jgi:hypothetical protein